MQWGWVGTTATGCSRSASTNPSRPASPGQILVCESVAAAAKDGLTAYELLGSRDAWTDVWTKEISACVNVLAMPRSLRGALGMATRWPPRRRRRARGLPQARQAPRPPDATSRYVAGPELGDALREENGLRRRRIR